MGARGIGFVYLNLVLLRYSIQFHFRLLLALLSVYRLHLYMLSPQIHMESDIRQSYDMYQHPVLSFHYLVIHRFTYEANVVEGL